MTSSIRVGLIGCGGIAKRHVNWFLGHASCEIGALCDTSTEAVEDKAALVSELRPDLEVSKETDYNALLARSDLDAVAVLLPHHLHHPVIKAALQAGKHVLTEKPMVTSVAEARELIALAESNNLHLGIAYQRSYIPEYRLVKQMVAKGELGKIQFINAHLEQDWLKIGQDVDARRRWRRDPAQSGGGQLVDTGSHTVAAMLDVSHLTPAEVFAFQDKSDLDIDVNTVLSVRFAEGALAAMTIGGYGSKAVTEVLRIVGDKGSARIFFRTVREQSLEVNGEMIDAKSTITASNPNENFVETLLGNTVIGATSNLGLRVAQLSEAAYQSAQTNQPILVN
ncbi:MAG: Gfo/Idh/MocA family oxidoreductase [Chloroflexota bacterium]